MDTQPTLTIRIPRFLTNLWQGRGRLGRALARQLVPNVGSVVLVLALLWATGAQAAPWHAPASAPAWPSTTTINYQGRLADSGGVPLDGNYGMSFALYDSDTGGALLWGPENHPAVPVSDGLFSVQLGGQTGGGVPTSVLTGDIWLEITVAGETLSPRERLGAVPYAMQASTALTVPDESITAEKIADGAITQTKAPTLLQSANGQNEIIRSGNNMFSGTDANGFIEVTYPCFPNGVRAFIAVNGHWNANHSRVIAHNGAGRCSTKIKLSSSTSNPIRINWIAFGN